MADENERKWKMGYFFCTPCKLGSGSKKHKLSFGSMFVGIEPGN